MENFILCAVQSSNKHSIFSNISKSLSRLSEWEINPICPVVFLSDHAPGGGGGHIVPPSPLRKSW